MKGAKTNKGQKGAQKAGNITQPALQPLLVSEDSEVEENGDKMLLADKTQASDILQELTSVSRDLREFKREMQKRDVIEELTTFKQDISQKLAETATTLQAQGEAISEAETHISDLEASGPVAKDAALLLLLNPPVMLRVKLTRFKV